MSLYQRFAYWSAHTSKRRLAALVGVLALLSACAVSLLLVVAAVRYGNSSILGIHPAVVAVVVLVAMVFTAWSVFVGERRRSRGQSETPAPHTSHLPSHSLSPHDSAEDPHKPIDS